MARVGHEGVDTTVGTVETAADLGGSVDLDVADVQQVGVQILKLGVGSDVLQEVQHELAGLLGPAGKGTREVLVLLGLGSTTNSTDGATEGDSILVVQHALEESLRLLESHSTDGMGSRVGVLEVHTQVRALSLGRYSFSTTHQFTISNHTQHNITPFSGQLSTLSRTTASFWIPF